MIRYDIAPALAAFSRHHVVAQKPNATADAAPMPDDDVRVHQYQTTYRPFVASLRPVQPLLIFPACVTDHSPKGARQARHEGR